MFIGLMSWLTDIENEAGRYGNRVGEDETQSLGGRASFGDTI